ncbi:MULTISPECIES: TetR/AcrR family transcriptional regulator [unclassified Streptomyces]|uniref:TetR/AcrR family transcriptional regulator n=1 Tax=unclassified Streptomyces TaxID=2593676 RepID=UPI000477C88D|nr:MULTISPECIES: TetR/AcrR family transcriptional regulator [unclassified Streptomyces]MYY03861.1 TetR family transcriptional regulator [Streptomyces sp. SID4913]
MGRWEPNARGRLEQAAMELYGERGYEQTTVTEIARRAGLSERTFFRHYADKREVLFGGSAALQDLLVAGLGDAPASAPAIDVVAAALDVVAASFDGRREFALRRQGIISANAELRERELIKLASLSAALAGALRARGVAEPAASLAAEAGIAVFKVAFERWIDGDGSRSMGHFTHEALAALRAVTAGA